MHRLLQLGAGLGLLGFAVGCHLTTGVCDCEAPGPGPAPIIHAQAAPAGLLLPAPYPTGAQPEAIKEMPKGKAPEKVPEKVPDPKEVKE